MVWAFLTAARHSERRSLSSGQFRHLCPGRVEPEPHVHLAVHRRRDGEVLARVIPLVRSPVEFAKAEVAVGDERAHPELLGQRPGLTIMAFRRLDVGRIRMGSDLAKETEGPRLMSTLPMLTVDLEAVTGEPPRRVEATR